MKKYFGFLLLGLLFFNCPFGVDTPDGEPDAIGKKPGILITIAPSPDSRMSIDQETFDVNQAVISVESPEGSFESKTWEKDVTGNQFHFMLKKTGNHKLRIVETDTGGNSYSLEKQINIQTFKNYRFRVTLGGNIEFIFENPEPTPAPTTPVAISYINTNPEFQNISGFGGAGIPGWRGDMTPEQIETAFSRENGIGMSVLRVRISPDSTEWEEEIPTINAAKSYGATVIASSWTAPESMKSNESLVAGTLNPGSYADYAAHLSLFNETVGGVYAISPINEPNVEVSYESMEMTAAEVADFVAAQGQNCGAPIMAPEPYNMSQEYINEYLSNTEAAANTDYLAGHIYGATPVYFDPGKEIWMTEHYVDSAVSGDDWEKSMDVAQEIHDCMTAGYSMYVWWYIVRYYGPIDEDGNITKTGYVMSHYAKWIRPGFRRISCTENPAPGVYTTAYKKDSDMVIVIINRNSEPVTQSFDISGMCISGFTGHTTSGISNLVTSSFPVQGNSFSLELRGSSITTLVSAGGDVPYVTLPPETPTPTPAPPPEGSILTIELESLSHQPLFAPFEVIDDAEASGGQAIVWPDNDNSYLVPASDTAEGQLEIIFTLTEDTDVEFRIRVNMTNGSNDTFYYKLDGNPWTQSGQETSGYETITVLNTMFDNLSAGQHTLWLERREDGAILDKIMLISAAGIDTIY